MRVVFLGYQTWGHTTLEALLGTHHDVPLVLTHPPSSHPYEAIWSDSVADLARAAGIEVVESTDADQPAVLAALRRARPDILLSSDWRTILSQTVLGVAPRGGLNIHDGLLPKYGGFAPVNWAIINGEDHAGVTLHFMTDDLDLGDIVLQQRVPIHENDTSAEVVARTMPLFAELPVAGLKLIEDGNEVRTPQDPTLSTFYHKRSVRDSRIDWTLSPRSVHNLIRAQADPYPNAHTTHKGKPLLVKRARLPARPYCGTPGRVFIPEGPGVVVLCGPDPAGLNQGVVLEVVQCEGEPPRPAVEHFTRMGEYLGEVVG